MEPVVIDIKGYWTTNYASVLESELEPKGKDFSDKYSFFGKLLLSEDGFLRGIVSDFISPESKHYVVGKLNSQIDQERADLIINKIGDGLLSPMVFEAEYNNQGTLNGTYGHVEDEMYYPSSEACFIILENEDKNMDNENALNRDMTTFVKNARPETIHLIEKLKKDPYHLRDYPEFSGAYDEAGMHI